jgi:hypothetical protein
LAIGQFSPLERSFQLLENHRLHVTHQLGGVVRRKAGPLKFTWHRNPAPRVRARHRAPGAQTPG